MNDLFNHELDLYTIAALTELFVLFVATCIYIKCFEGPEKDCRSVWMNKRLLSLFAAALLVFTPVNILAGSEGSPLIFFCMLLGSIVVSADAGITFAITCLKKHSGEEKEKE